MENHNNIDPIDRQHDIKLVNDKIAVIGELEHIRRHALRSYVATKEKANDEIRGANSEVLKERSVGYLLTAIRATKCRREYMDRHFGQLLDEDWCLVKSAATLRQLLYETEETGEDIDDMGRMIDNICGDALNMDLTGCRDCNEDRHGE